MKSVYYLALFVTLAVFPTIGFAADKAEIEAIIKEYLQNHPEVILQSLKKYEATQRKRQEETTFNDSIKNRVKLEVAGSPVKGPEDAKITIFEFSDFQCPYCARSQVVVEEVLKRHKGNIRIVFKHLPLSFHKKAKDASRASMAAGEQGKFWEYKAKLMASLNQWANGNAPQLFILYAKELGLDVKKFEEDQKKESYNKAIEKDVALAGRIGARGTPTFVINGVIVRGAQPIEHFEKVIALTLKEG